MAAEEMWTTVKKKFAAIVLNCRKEDAFAKLPFVCEV